jgi:threonylcarbamoyladenosine tRNA methylthiotransferase MtaB
MSQRKGRTVSGTLAASRKHVAFRTFGCRLNQYDSDCLKGEFRTAGYSVAQTGENAPLFVINTCSVTAEAERQARQCIRKISRECPEARIVVTGCYANRAAHEIESLPSVVCVVKNADKQQLLALTAGAGSAQRPNHVESQLTQQLEDLRPLSLERTRPYLRVQDGCDNCCSYCIVPFTRGSHRSADPDWVLEEAQKLLRLGAREIVLTGARLGSYGSGVCPSLHLVGLLDSLTGIRGDVRFRLSSIEPDELSPSLINAIGDNPKLCAHLHVPLQSGSDPVLSRMGRGYSAAHYREIIEEVRAKLPHCAIGTDIIVGFPGETDRDFQETARLLEEAPISYCHVFPYSRRPGTAAASMQETVSRLEKAGRSRRLRAIGGAKWLSFRRSLIGTVSSAILERVQSGRLGVGVTENYQKVGMPERLWRKRGFTHIVQTGADEHLSYALPETGRIL